MNVTPIATLATPLVMEPSEASAAPITEVEQSVALEFAALLAGLLTTPKPPVIASSAPAGGDVGGGSDPEAGPTEVPADGSMPAVLRESALPVMGQAVVEEAAALPTQVRAPAHPAPPLARIVTASPSVEGGTAIGATAAPTIPTTPGVPQSAAPTVPANEAAQQGVTALVMSAKEQAPVQSTAPGGATPPPEAATLPIEGVKAVVASLADTIIDLAGRVTGRRPATAPVAPPSGDALKSAPHSAQSADGDAIDDAPSIGGASASREEAIHSARATAVVIGRQPANDSAGGFGDGAAADHQKQKSAVPDSPMPRVESDAGRSAVIDLSRLAGSAQVAPLHTAPSTGTVAPAAPPSPSLPPDPPRTADVPQVVTIRFEAPGGGGESHPGVGSRGCGAGHHSHRCPHCAAA